MKLKVAKFRRKYFCINKNYNLEKRMVTLSSKKMYTFLTFIMPPVTRISDSRGAVDVLFVM